MSTRLRGPTAPLPAETPAMPANRKVWVAVTLGLLLGQLGYLYTNQTKRLMVSMILGTLALTIACALAWHQVPSFDLDAITRDPQALLDYDQKLTAALSWPSIVAGLNNLACAVDLYVQITRAQRAG